jgi:WD40 repeat protein
MTAVSATAANSSHTLQVNSIVQISSVQVASGSNDSKIKTWNLDQSLVNTFTGHLGSVMSLGLLGGGLLGSVATDGCFFQWTAVNASTMTHASINCGGVSSFAWSPVGSIYLLVSYICHDIYYKTWKLTGTYNAIDIIPTSGHIVGVGATLDLVLWPSITVNFTVSNNGTILCRLKVLPDSVTVVVGGTNGLLRLFNTITRTFGASQSVHTTRIVMLDVTPDLSYLVTAAADNTVIMWLWSNLTQVMAFSPSVTGTLSAGVVITSNFTGTEASQLYKKKKI